MTIKAGVGTSGHHNPNVAGREAAERALTNAGILLNRTSCSCSPPSDTISTPCCARCARLPRDNPTSSWCWPFSWLLDQDFRFFGRRSVIVVNVEAV